MIPILYKAKETDFTHNGIGFLIDAISCTVTENRNGAYEAEFTYPVNSPLYKYIKEDCYFKAKPNETSEPQIFRIYKSSKPMNRKVTFYGEHISYCLSGNPIESIKIENENAQAAISKIFSAGIFEHGFTGQSDIETLNSTSLSFVSIRAALGGVEGSLLDVYGGEYEFDNFVVKLHAHRGRDTGIRIAYGKNLTDIKQDRNISEVYTAVYPYVKYTPEATDTNPEPAEITVTLPEKVIYSEHAAQYSHQRAFIKNFADQFEKGEEITVENLRIKAQQWAQSSGFDVPKVGITVSFETLWDKPEYAEYAILERVALCDTLSVEYSELGVSAKAKVIKTVYDVLKERYNSVELGDARSNLADTINQNTAAIEGAKQEIKMQATAANTNLMSAIAKATAAITGQSGGYVVLNPSHNPQEVLIMDAPKISEAVKIWRWNSGGLGYSNNGYNGPFKLAITNDGAIVADFITAGQLNGNVLKASTIQADAISAETFRIIFNKASDYIMFEDGKLKVIDDSEKERAVLGSTGLEIFKGSIVIYKGDNKYSTPALMVDDNGNMALDGYLMRNGSPIKMTVGYDQNYYHGIYCYAEHDYYKRSDGTYAPFMEFWSSTGDPKTSMLVGVTKLGFAVKDTDPDSHSVYSRLHITANGGELLGQWQFAQEQNFSSNIGANCFKLFDGNTHIASFYHSTSDNPCLFSNNGNPLLIGVNGNTAITARSNGGTLCGTWNFTQDQYFTYSIYGWNIGVYRNGVLKSQLYNSDSGINAWASMDGSDLRLVIKSGDNWNARLAATTKGGNLWGEWEISTDSGYASLVTDRTGNGGGHLWGTWYLASDIAITSDANKKNSIEPLDERYSVLFDNLKAVRHKYNDGTSARYHTDLIAQDVEKALKIANLDTSEFAAFVKTDEDEYYLRYAEFIALAVNEIQILKDKNSKLEERVTELEEKINSIIQRLEE